MRTWCGQGPQISGLVISHAVLPATKHDANPFEGQGSHYGMVVLTTLALLLDSSSESYTADCRQWLDASQQTGSVDPASM
jgi:hypothetical protein